MSIKNKFFALAGLAGAIMVVVSCIGYYIAYTNLSKSIDDTIIATTETKAESLSAWVDDKAEIAKSTANIMTNLGSDSDTYKKVHPILKLAENNSDVADVTVGDEKGNAFSYQDGDATGSLIPSKRPWYKDVKAKNKLIYTPIYEDFSNDGKKENVFSIAAPYYRNNQFYGATCIDIRLNVLEECVKTLKYHGQGEGYIIAQDGTIIATSDKNLKIKNVNDSALLKKDFPKMLQQKKGYFTFNDNGTEEIVSFATLPQTGWLILLSVPTSYVFAPLHHLQLCYTLLSLFGIIIIVFSCLRFSSKIVKGIIKLKDASDEIANGNLRINDIPVTSSDELGVLTTANNTMKHNIRSLLTKMSSTAEQVAASSEELTASAQQSAEASNHVAQTVTEVAESMEKQLKNINEAKFDVESVSSSIQNVADKTEVIAQSSRDTAIAAQQGETLMHGAVTKMGTIEANVTNSAEVVRKLGESSQQIGQIVDAISSIADQTNLLALNAAIEAARAGEHGKGFAVVAEEVRKLAVESQSSAEQIKDRISAIQADTAKAVSVMESSTADVQSGTESIRNVGTKFNAIMQMVNSINSQMGDINTSVQTVSEGAQKIVTAVNSIDKFGRRVAEQTQSISATTEEQSASTEEIASASNSLAQMSTELKEATDKFKI